MTIEEVTGGAVINRHQDFDNAAVAENMAHIAKPANEQMPDKLQALITSR